MMEPFNRALFDSASKSSLNFQGWLEVGLQRWDGCTTSHQAHAIRTPHWSDPVCLK